MNGWISWLEALGRFVGYGCVFAMVGAVTMRWGITRRAGSGPELVTSARELESALVRSGIYAALILTIVSLVSLYLQTYALFGIDEGVTIDYMRLVAFETPWGLGWRWHMGAALVAFVVFCLAANRPTEGWIAAVPSVLFVAASVSFTGHSVSLVSPPVGILVQSVHVIAAGTWIGSLALLFVFVLIPRKKAPTMFKSGLIEAFSPVAVGAVASLAVAGVVSAILYVDSWRTLFTTSYGRLLILKVTVFAATGLIGLYNWKVVRPKLKEAGTGILERTVRYEMVAAIGTLLITAFLVALSPEHTPD